MDVLGDQWHQIAQERKPVDLQLLKLGWLPSVELRVVRIWIKVHEEAVEEPRFHDLVVGGDAL